MAMDRPDPGVLDVMTLERPDGQLAYDARGAGPLVICTPGAGDLRSSFARYAQRLAQEGCRVVTADLRGHGESSLGWPSYTDPQIADDLLTLADQLTAEPVILAASGSSAAAAILLASFRPDQIAALVLFNPEFIEPRASRRRARLERLAGWPRLSRRLWLRHWRQAHVARPDDLSARHSQLDAKLAEPGRFEAVLSMLADRAGPATRDEATQGADPAGLLPHVTCPVLVMMGENDPDVAEPGLSAQTIVEHLGGPARVLLVPGVGHFPQAEVPQIAASQTSAFLHTHALI